MKKKIFVVFVFLQIASFVKAQNDNDKFIDSLKYELNKPTHHDTTKISILFKLVESINNDSVWPQYNERVLPLAYNLLNSNDSKIQLIAQKAIADVHNNRGYLYKIRGNTKLALENYIKALKISEKINYEYGQISISINLATILSQQKQFEEALKYYNYALQLSLKNNNLTTQAIALKSIAGIFYLNNQYDSTEVYLLKSKSIFEQLNDVNRIGEIYNGLGVLYFKIKKQELALNYHYKALNCFKITNNILQLSNTYYNFSKLLNNPNNLKNLYSALTYLDTAFIYANKIYFMEGVSDLYHLKSEIFHNLSRSKELNLQQKYDYAIKSLENFKLHKLYSDSIFNKEVLDNTIKQQLNYEFDKKTAILQEQQLRERQLALAEKKKQSIIIGFTISGIVILLIFLLLLNNRFKLTKKQKQIIEKQKQLVEEKNKEITDSINYAKRIQEAILPNKQKWNNLLSESFILYLPKDIVAGDFYWLEETEGYIYVAAADSTGHGVPGAMVSVVCSNALTKAVTEGELKNTNEILNRTREIVIEKLSSDKEENIRDGMDVCLVRINKKNKKQIQYSGANRPLYIVQNGELKEITPDKQPIGQYEKSAPFAVQDIVLESAGMLYLSTDGYADQFGGDKQKKLTNKKFKELLIQVSDLPAVEQYSQLHEHYQHWKDNLEQVDDVTVIGLRL
jgi:serine phosphatase RsbU (regulator of sigma subunit)